MAYSSGGLIAATDYNNFVGTPTGAGTLNYVWSTGNGQFGYGQSAVSQAAAANGTITAAQWATLINTLNTARTHQSGSGTGISATTAGAVITYLSTLSSSITTLNSNKLTFATQGTTVTGTTISPNFTAVNQEAASTFTITRTCTFSSGDAARYFFNAGGQLNFIVSSAANNDSTNRSGDLVTLAATNLAGYTAFRAASGGGRTGTGATLNTNATGIGYYNLTTVNQTLVSITSTTANYTSDTAVLSVKSNGVQGANADVGTVVTFTLVLTSAAQPAAAAPPGAGPGGSPPVNNTSVNDSINITVNHRIDVVPPESTNLTSSWGSVTIA
jgi:hypothetical protein